MRKIVILGAIVAALGAAGSAQAGCWATVGLGPGPEGVAAGSTWRAELHVLQHGRTPLAGATPFVTITDAATGETRTFAATPSATPGDYMTTVIFPAAGDWAVSVHDGFPEAECAQTHTFGSFAIAAPASPAPPADGGSGFPVGTVALGAGLGAAAIALLAVLAAKMRGRAAARTA